jgi:hypothetical protein
MVDFLFILREQNNVPQFHHINHKVTEPEKGMELSRAQGEANHNGGGILSYLHFNPAFDQSDEAMGDMDSPAPSFPFQKH